MIVRATIVGIAAVVPAVLACSSSQATTIINFDAMLHLFDHAFEGTVVAQKRVPSDSPLSWRSLCGVEYEIAITKVTKGLLSPGISLPFNATFRGLENGKSYRFYVHDDPRQLQVERDLRSGLPQNDPLAEESFVLSCRGKLSSPFTLGGVSER